MEDRTLSVRSFSEHTHITKDIDPLFISFFFFLVTFSLIFSTSFSSFPPVACVGLCCLSRLCVFDIFCYSRPAGTGRSRATRAHSSASDRHACILYRCWTFFPCPLFFVSILTMGYSKTKSLRVEEKLNYHRCEMVERGRRNKKKRTDRRRPDEINIESNEKHASTERKGWPVVNQMKTREKCHLVCKVPFETLATATSA